jgi:hypothetical protein
VGAIECGQVKYRDEEGRALIGENPVKALSETRAWYRVDRRRTVIKPHELEPWVKAVLGLRGDPVLRHFFP